MNSKRHPQRNNLFGGYIQDFMSIKNLGRYIIKPVVIGLTLSGTYNIYNSGLTYAGDKSGIENSSSKQGKYEFDDFGIVYLKNDPIQTLEIEQLETADLDGDGDNNILLVQILEE